MLCLLVPLLVTPEEVTLHRMDSLRREADSALNVGREHLKNGRRNEATERLRFAKAKYLESLEIRTTAPVLWNLSLALRGLGEFAPSELAESRALEMDPSLVRLQNPIEK